MAGQPTSIAARLAYVSRANLLQFCRARLTQGVSPVGQSLHLQRSLDRFLQKCQQCNTSNRVDILRSGGDISVTPVTPAIRDWRPWVRNASMGSEADPVAVPLDGRLRISLRYCPSQMLMRREGAMISSERPLPDAVGQSTSFGARASRTGGANQRSAAFEEGHFGPNRSCYRSDPSSWRCCVGPFRDHVFMVSTPIRLSRLRTASAFTTMRRTPSKLSSPSDAPCARLATSGVRRLRRW